MIFHTGVRKEIIFSHLVMLNLTHMTLLGFSQYQEPIYCITVQGLGFDSARPISGVRVDKFSCTSLLTFVNIYNILELEFINYTRVLHSRS